MFGEPNIKNNILNTILIMDEEFQYTLHQEENIQFM